MCGVRHEDDASLLADLIHERSAHPEGFTPSHPGKEPLQACLPIDIETEKNPIGRCAGQDSFHSSAGKLVEIVDALESIRHGHHGFEPANQVTTGLAEQLRAVQADNLGLLFHAVDFEAIVPEDQWIAVEQGKEVRWQLGAAETRFDRQAGLDAQFQAMRSAPDLGQRTMDLAKREGNLPLPLTSTDPELVAGEVDGSGTAVPIAGAICSLLGRNGTHIVNPDLIGHSLREVSRIRHVAGLKTVRPLNPNTDQRDSVNLAGPYRRAQPPAGSRGRVSR